MRLVSLGILAVLLMTAGPAVAKAGATSAKSQPSPGPTATTPAEAALGKKTAEQIEKETKLVVDEAKVAKLNAMAAAIAKVTERPDVAYTCKILDTEALNAISIPGGTIYFTKGILAAVESDDELAGVMAHEIAHNALCHVRKSLEKQNRASLAQIATVLAAVYVNKDKSDVSTMQLITMSELVKESLLNGYSVELEAEADRRGVEYLHTLGKYDPVGLYSVILGFQHMEAQAPRVSLGYLKTHPHSGERRALLEKYFAEHRITINIWNVVNFRASMIPPAKEGGEGHGVRLGTVEVITLTVADGDTGAEARAQRAVAAMNARLTKAFIRQFDVDSTIKDGRAAIRMRMIPVLTLTQADADAAGMTLDALATLTTTNIKNAIWHEQVKRF